MRIRSSSATSSALILQEPFGECIYNRRLCQLLLESECATKFAFAGICALQSLYFVSWCTIFLATAPNHAPQLSLRQEIVPHLLEILLLAWAIRVSRFLSWGRDAEKVSTPRKAFALSPSSLHSRTALLRLYQSFQLSRAKPLLFPFLRTTPAFQLLSFPSSLENKSCQRLELLHPTWRSSCLRCQPPSCPPTDSLPSAAPPVQAPASSSAHEHSPPTKLSTVRISSVNAHAHASAPPLSRLLKPQTPVSVCQHCTHGLTHRGLPLQVQPLPWASIPHE